MIDITAWVMQTIVILIFFLLFEEHNTVISIKGFQTEFTDSTVKLPECRSFLELYAVDGWKYLYDWWATFQLEDLLKEFLWHVLNYLGSKENKSNSLLQLLRKQMKNVLR